MPHVVSCLLIHGDTLLILKRSDKVRTYKGLWGGVAGYIEQDEKPIETALKEIQEEVHLQPKDVTLLREETPFSFTDTYEEKQYTWTVHPFVFEVEKKDKVQIDWEHSRYTWISPQDIRRYKVVPHFKEMVSKILL
jgi:8-oxo-dGTP pyrophosphatase MutT (NUDIX family)